MEPILEAKVLGKEADFGVVATSPKSASRTWSFATGGSDESKEHFDAGGLALAIRSEKAKTSPDWTVRVRSATAVLVPNSLRREGGFWTAGGMTKDEGRRTKDETRACPSSSVSRRLLYGIGDL